jgi:hypothetical protein
VPIAEEVRKALAEHIAAPARSSFPGRAQGVNQAQSGDLGPTRRNLMLAWSYLDLADYLLIA